MEAFLSPSLIVILLSVTTIVGVTIYSPTPSQGFGKCGSFASLVFEWKRRETIALTVNSAHSLSDSSALFMKTLGFVYFVG